MNTLLYVVLSMSLAGSLLIGIMLFAEHFLGRRISFVWQYWLWAVVIARLLIPGGISYTTQPVVTVETEQAAQTPAAVPDKGTETAGVSLSAAAAPEEKPAAAAPEENGWQLFVENLWAVWLIGAAVLAIRRITAYQSVVRCLRAGMTYCEDTELLNAVSEAAEMLHIRRPVELAVNPIAASPLLIGVFRPCIIVPGTAYSKAELTNIAVHELVHLRRGDPVYKWAVQLAVCIHWFNPLVHYMARRIDRLCELSCDRQAVRVLGNPEAYGSTLLHVMADCGRFRAADGTVELSANKRLLKERLEKMKTYTTAGPQGVILALLLTAVILVSVSCTATYAPWQTRKLPVRADNVQAVTGIPSALQVHVKDCYVQLEPGSDNRLRADYDTSRFDVQIQETDGTTAVLCSGRTALQKQKYITLYVPADTLSSLDADVTEGMMTVRDIRADAMAFTVWSGAAALQLPDAAAGTLTASVKDGLFILESDDGFADTDVQAELHQSLLTVSDDMQNRIVRSGDTASINTDGADFSVQISAESAAVGLGLPVTDEIAEWSAGGFPLTFAAGWADAWESGFETQAEDLAEQTEAQIEGKSDNLDSISPVPSMPPAPRLAEGRAGSTGSTDADPAQTQSPGSLGNAIAGGISSILNGVGSGVSGILSGVGDGVSSILEGVDGFWYP